MVKKKRSKQKDRNRKIYLDVKLEFEGKPQSEITKDIFGYIVISAVKIFHGEVAVADPIDVIDYDQPNFQATVTCSQHSLEKVWSALTMYGNYNGQRCIFHVTQIASQSNNQDESSDEPGQMMESET